MGLNVTRGDWTPFSEEHPRPQKRQAESRFETFNPDERMILETLLQDHANTVSTISRSIEPTPEGVYKYLAAIEALENECRKVG